MMHDLTHNTSLFLADLFSTILIYCMAFAPIVALILTLGVCLGILFNQYVDLHVRFKHGQRDSETH